MLCEAEGRLLVTAVMLLAMSTVSLRVHTIGLSEELLMVLLIISLMGEWIAVPVVWTPPGRRRQLQLGDQ